MKSLHRISPRNLAFRWAVLSLIAGGAATVAAPPLFAQDEIATFQDQTIDSPYRWIERGTRLGLVGGYVFANRGDPPFGPGPTAVLGARLRARVSSPLSLEFGVVYGSSNQYVTDPRLEGGPAVVDTVDADWIIIEASLQFSFTGARTYRKLQPYFLVGGGILQGLSTQESEVLTPPKEPFEYQIGTAGMVNVGLGVEYIVSSRLGLAMEARDNLWRIKTPDGWFQLNVLQNILDSGAVAPDQATWTNNIELTATLYYYF